MSSDIRKFFGGDKRGPSSALSALKQTSLGSPQVARSPEKKKQPKKESKAIKQDIIDEFESDGESPLPKSAKTTTAKSNKRKPIVLSDSDEDTIPRPRSKISKPVSESPSPRKLTRTRKVIISSGSEASPSPSKKQSKLHNDRPPSDNSFEEYLISDEEPIPPSKAEKGLLPGQKKLTLTTQTKKAEAKSKPTPDLKKVSADEFFSSGGFTQAPEMSRKGNESQKIADSAKKRSASKNKTPPSNKKEENMPKKQRTPKKIVEEEDEFVEKDEISKKSITKKKAEIAKSAAQKRKDLDNEFIEYDEDDFPIKPKKAKISPSSKENQPQRASDKRMSKDKEARNSVQQKDVVKPPTFIAGTSSTWTKPDDESYELPWVDKYKPKTLSQLVGQHGDKSPLNKLLAWLKDWSKHNLGEGAKVSKPKPAPWQNGGDGTPFKAALLSGSPGVGKTTCAHIACENLGLQFVEMNASDVRNKKHLEAKVAQLTGSHQIEEYFGSKSMTNHEDNETHHVLIMDEVDGMSGNEDRAGISELIQIIKETKIPILCICNDRSLPKMRSLVNYCYDLRFPKPRIEQIRGRIMSIAAQEKVKLDKNELDELIELSGHDVRQTIYNLQMRSTSISSKIEQKDCAINTFEAARKLLDTRSTWLEKQEMFFVDYSIMPLFVQENYLNMKNKKHSMQESLKCIREASDLISLGDTVDRCLRSTGAWKLLNEEAMFSAILPSIAIGGHLSAMLQFPSWLGKNSTAGKRQRLMRQIACHSHLKISADTHSLVTDYVPVLRNALTEPLIQRENEGIPAVVAVMDEYDLLKDDAEAIAELAVWPGKIDPASKIQSKTKAALTRTLNKGHRMLPYHLDEVSKGRKKPAAAQAELEIDEEGNVVERIEGDEAVEDEEEESGSAEVIVNAPSNRSRGGGRGAARGARGGGTRGTRGKK